MFWKGRGNLFQKVSPLSDEREFEFMNMKKRECREYTPEFRSQAGQLVIKEGVSLVKAASDLGISMGTLNGWLGKFRSGQWCLETGGPKLASDSDAAKLKTRNGTHVSADQQRIQELERQVRRLTLEREILKKAMAYCIEIPK